MALSEEYKTAKIASLTTRIASLEAAVAALETGTIKTYTYNDGQYSQSVTKKDSWKLDQQIQSLEGQLSRLSGGGQCYVRGG